MAWSQLVDLLGALEDVFPVKVAQLDFGHVFGLDFIDAEADHQVGHHLGLLVGFPDDADSLVDVQQDFLQPPEQVELVLGFLQVEIHPPAHAFGAEGDPLLQDPAHAQHLGHAGDEQVEIAGEGVLQRGHGEQPVHQLVRVDAPLEVDGDFQAVQADFVAHVSDFPHPAAFDQIRQLGDDGLHGGGKGNFGDVNAVGGLVVGIDAADFHAAPTGFVDFLQSPPAGRPPGRRRENPGLSGWR